jgi:hypothetical protein
MHESMTCRLHADPTVFERKVHRRRLKMYSERNIRKCFLSSYRTLEIGDNIHVPI